MNFNISIWKKISKKNLILIISFIIISLILLISFLIHYLNPRITYSYDSKSDTYSVKKAYGLADTYTIKSSFRGKKVTKISKRAFENMNVSHIIFEEDSNITTIEARAFYNTKIVDLELPDSVVDIYEDAFAYCNDLVKVSTSINSKYNKIAGSTFFNCTNLKEVNINNISSVGTWAFYNCINLNELHLDDFCYVYNQAFYNCNIILYINDTSNFSVGFDTGANIIIK